MAAKAYAYLCGADEVLPEHLTILSHVLWNDPGEQQKKAGEIVQKIANPTGHRINELLLQSENVVRENKPADAYPKLESIRDQIKALSDHPKKARAVECVSDHIARIFKSVVGVR
jgi:MoxR-like ATPase